jgi:hypothetical protein
MNTSTNENTGDGREQDDVRARELEAARQQDLPDQQQHRRHPRDEQQERRQDGHLAGDVVEARQRLRQVDLQGVGLAVLRDEPGADVDREQEDEEVLLLEEVAEDLGGWARGGRRLGHALGHVEHGQPHHHWILSRTGSRSSAAAAEERPDAAAGDHQPGAPAPAGGRRRRRR